MQTYYSEWCEEFLSVSSQTAILTESAWLWLQTSWETIMEIWKEVQFLVPCGGGIPFIVEQITFKIFCGVGENLLISSVIC